MTGLNGQRVYLDWNATAPLRTEARQAILEAMDVVGNPSSVHAEGRAAKAIVEKARGQVAALVGCDPDEVVFTSGATEAINAAILAKEWDCIALNDTEHDAVDQSVRGKAKSVGSFSGPPLTLDEPIFKFGDDCDGFNSTVPMKPAHQKGTLRLVCLSEACGETGIVHMCDAATVETVDPLWLRDSTQLCGRSILPGPYAQERANNASHYGKPAFRAASSHKLGGPKGAGCLVVRSGIEIDHPVRGGGQEQGRRSGTENVIGIAGFGAAAEAAQRDLEAGVWDRVESLRNLLEDTLASAAHDTIFFGKESPRLPNTSCFAIPGWAGETQVMQMDLTGFAVSAGSACSSGKVNKASRVLLAMGFDEITASSAIRVSMGPTTTEAEVMAFADAWKDAYRRRKARAA